MVTLNDLTPAVLAHQGGWDEIIFVVVPMVVLAGLLRLAKRRAEREAADESASLTPADTSEAGTE